MITLDQFETEDNVFYSGSYVDNVMLGVLAGTSSDGGTVETTRNVIALKTDGLRAAFDKRKLLYNTFLSYASGSRVGTFRRTNFATTQDLYYFDSYAGSILDIYQQFSNGSFIMLESKISGSQEFNLPEIADPRIISGAGGLMIHMYNGLGTNAWNVSYPFQSQKTLKTLTRNLQPAVQFTNPVSIDFTESLNPVSPVSSSANISFLVYGQGNESNWQFVTSLVKHPSASIGLSGLSDIKRFESIRTSIETLHNVFFGIGDGLTHKTAFPAADATNGPYIKLGHTLPDFKSVNTGGLYDTTNISFDVLTVNGPILRGYKYGLYSSLPKKLGQHYRVGNFGQLRDLLEQRPITTTINFSDGKVTVDYPIFITFVSGTLSYNRSLDYATASNPTYNPTDSGIYDLHYRSGQPFSDTNSGVS